MKTKGRFGELADDVPTPQAPGRRYESVLEWRLKSSVFAGEARTNPSKLSERSWNVYENKGELWRTRKRSAGLASAGATLRRVAHTCRRFLSGCMRHSVMRRGTVSLAKAEASFRNGMNNAVRPSMFCIICGGFASTQHHLVRGSALGPMSV
jgi:hypothetical protein